MNFSCAESEFKKLNSNVNFLCVCESHRSCIYSALLNLIFLSCSYTSAHPLPVVGRQMSDLVLRDELLQDLGNIVEVGFILLKLHPVDQRCQLVHLLLRTLVVASQILGQLLYSKNVVKKLFMLMISLTSVYSATCV